MTDKEMIEAAAADTGFTIQSWGVDEDGDFASLGPFTVTESDEDAGLFEGDEGDLRLSIVGAEQYGNRRVHWGLLIDGLDTLTDVNDITILEPVA